MVKPKSLLHKIRERTKQLRSKTPPGPVHSEPLDHKHASDHPQWDPWFTEKDRENFPNSLHFSDFSLHHHKILGEGTFSRVILGTHIPTKEMCAVKMIEKKMLTPTMKTFILNEPKYLTRLKDKRIVQLLHFHEDQSFVYLFLNYIPGSNLHDRLDSMGILYERTARLWFSQLVEILEFCHTKGICHRDIKLENVILESKAGVPKLTLVDFGFAADLNKGLCYEFPGSLTYAPPELVQSIPYDGSKADIYSLGVILYSFLQPGYPFYAEERKDLINMIIHADPEFTFPLSRNAEDLIRWMLSKNPEERPTLQQIKAHPFYIGNDDDVPKKSMIRSPVQLLRKIRLN